MFKKIVPIIFSFSCSIYNAYGLNTKLMPGFIKSNRVEVFDLIKERQKGQEGSLIVPSRLFAKSKWYVHVKKDKWIKSIQITKLEIICQKKEFSKDRNCFKYIYKYLGQKKVEGERNFLLASKDFLEFEKVVDLKEGDGKKFNFASNPYKQFFKKSMFGSRSKFSSCELFKMPENYAEISCYGKELLNNSPAALSYIIDENKNLIGQSFILDDYVKEVRKQYLYKYLIKTNRGSILLLKYKFHKFSNKDPYGQKYCENYFSFGYLITQNNTSRINVYDWNPNFDSCNDF